MTNSILNSTKKVLGISADYDAFDVDILMHINSVFNTLNDLGIGPSNGFMIEDEVPEWEDFLGEDLNLNSVKTLTYLKVRLAFDPPPTSFGITAMENQIREQEWRISSRREAKEWVEPVSATADPLFELPVIDGGTG